VMTAVYVQFVNNHVDFGFAILDFGLGRFLDRW